MTIRKDAQVHHETVRRLAHRCRQTKKKNKDSQVQDALIVTVAKFFAPPLEATRISASLREMPFGKRLDCVFRELDEPNVGELELTKLLVFMVVYFIEHHEWLRPRLESKYTW